MFGENLLPVSQTVGYLLAVSSCGRRDKEVLWSLF